MMKFIQKLEELNVSEEVLERMLEDEQLNAYNEDVLADAIAWAKESLAVSLNLDDMDDVVEFVFTDNNRLAFQIDVWKDIVWANVEYNRVRFHGDVKNGKVRVWEVALFETDTGLESGWACYEVKTTLKDELKNKATELGGQILEELVAVENASADAYGSVADVWEDITDGSMLLERLNNMDQDEVEEYIASYYPCSACGRV